MALQNNKALQFRPGYVACSFIFLLLGLASLSSSINLLVLRFMILTLEEEEDEEVLQVLYFIYFLGLFYPKSPLRPCFEFV